jgi:hypothetical protein
VAMHQYCDSRGSKAADVYLQVVRLRARHHGGLDAMRVNYAKAPVPAYAASVAGLVRYAPPDAQGEPHKGRRGGGVLQATQVTCTIRSHAQHNLAVQDNRAFASMPNTLHLADVQIGIRVVEDTCTFQYRQICCVLSIAATISCCAY